MVTVHPGWTSVNSPDYDDHTYAAAGVERIREAGFWERLGWRQQVDERQREIGASLRRLREAAGLSQAKLAALVGMSGAALCNIERGHQRINHRTEDHLREVLIEALEVRR